MRSPRLPGHTLPSLKRAWERTLSVASAPKHWAFLEDPRGKGLRESHTRRQTDFLGEPRRLSRSRHYT